MGLKVPEECFGFWRIVEEDASFSWEMGNVQIQNRLLHTGCAQKAPVL